MSNTRYLLKITTCFFLSHSTFLGGWWWLKTLLRLHVCYGFSNLWDDSPRVVLVSITVRLFSDWHMKNRPHTTDRQWTAPRRYRLPSLYRGTKHTRHQSSKHGFVQRSTVYSSVCLSIYPSVQCVPGVFLPKCKRLNQFHPLKVSTLCRGVDLFLPKLFLQTSLKMKERSENEQ